MGNRPAVRLAVGQGWRGTSMTHAGRLVTGDREYAGFLTEPAGGLGAHQRHHPERPGLHLYLRHHAVFDHSGDQSGEPVTGGLAHDRAGAEPAGQHGLLAGDPGEFGALDDPPTGVVDAGLQPAGIGPTAHRVVADPEQPGRLSQPKNRHAPIRTDVSICGSTKPMSP